MLGIRRYKGVSLSLYQGDITTFVADVIVNAANSALKGGGGVDGAIHAAGGPDILKECKEIGHCPPGEAVMTTGGHLPCQKIIHTVGPIWKGGNSGEAEILSSCYRKSLQLANQTGLHHVSFSAISTGIYGYPVEQAAEVAMKEAKTYLDHVSQHTLKRITFVLFSGEHYKAYQASLYSTFPDESDHS